MFKLDLEKAEEPDIKWPTSIGSSKKQESSRNTSTSLLLTMPKPLIVCTTTNCGNFLKRSEYQTTFPASREICMQTRKHIEQQTGSKSRKEYIKAIYCHPAYLTFMQNTSWEMPGWMKDKLESNNLRYLYWNINNFRYTYNMTLTTERN